MVWYSHLFQNFPQFIVIHTVKGFGILNKAEIDVFQELFCFFDDPAVSLGRFIPRHFILFVLMINGIVSLIYNYRNERDFYVLILYPVALPNSLVSSSSFLVASLGYSMCRIMSSANSDSFTSFSIWIHFISFSSLIAMAMTPKTLLNSSDGCVFFLILEEILCFSPLGMIFAMHLSRMPFIILRFVLSMAIVWRVFLWS